MEDAQIEAAWRENRILEKYFAPVLRIPTPDGPAAHALSDDQVTGLRPGSAAAAGGRSDANPIAIYTWRRGAYWTVVLGSAAVLILLTTRLRAGPAARRAPEDVHA
jgi:hypothetical protein